MHNCTALLETLTSYLAFEARERLECAYRAATQSALVLSTPASSTLKLLLKAQEMDCLFLKPISKVSQTSSSILIMCHMEGCLQEGCWCPPHPDLARVLVLHGARVKERARRFCHSAVGLGGCSQRSQEPTVVPGPRGQVPPGERNLGDQEHRVVRLVPGLHLSSHFRGPGSLHQLLQGGLQ